MTPHTIDYISHCTVEIHSVFNDDCASYLFFLRKDDDFYFYLINSYMSVKFELIIFIIFIFANNQQPITGRHLAFYHILKFIFIYVCASNYIFFRPFYNTVLHPLIILLSVTFQSIAASL